MKDEKECFSVRNNTMKKQRYSEGKTLQEIGEIHGVSRERVRKIVGNTGLDFRARWTEENIKSMEIESKTSSEVLSINANKKVLRNHLAKTRHKIKGGHPKYGAEIEELVSRMLRKERISHRLMFYRSAFDIELENGKRIDVKGASKTSHPKSQNRPFYSIKIDKRRRGNYADFFIVVIQKEIVFVIPSDVLPERCSNIRIFWPSKYKTKWEKYIDRFDLLRQ